MDEHNAIQDGSLDLVASFYNEDNSLAGEFNLNTLPLGGIVFDADANEYIYILDQSDAVGPGTLDGNNDGFQTGIALTDPDGSGANNAEAFALTDLTNNVVIDFYDIGGGTTGITPAAGVGAVGTVSGGTLASTNIPTLVNPNSTTTSIQFNQPDPDEVVYDDLSPGDTGVICFAEGTQINGQNGNVNIEDLNSGDLVWTKDNGLQPIRWLGRREVGAKGKFAPIKIEAGHFGLTQDLFVSPNHRIALRSAVAELMIDQHEFLVPAKHLLDHPGVSSVKMETIVYYHMLFDQHELVQSNGIWSESLHPGAQALSTLQLQSRLEVLELFPELNADQSHALSRPEILRRELSLVLKSSFAL